MVDKSAPEEMVCKKCGGLRGMGYIDPKTDEEFYDHCLGKLPGVISACCGHGGEGHILFENGIMVRFSNIQVEKNYQDRSDKLPVYGVNSLRSQ